MNQHRRFWYGLIAVGVAGLIIIGVVTFVRLGQVLDGIARQQDEAEEQRRFATTLQIVSVSCAAGFTDFDEQRRIAATQQCVAVWLRHHDLADHVPKE